MKTGRSEVVLVNVPAGLGKKPFDLAFPFIRRLNYGLLSLATALRHHGFGVALLDFQVVPEQDLETWLSTALARLAPRIVGISCISGFSYPESLRVAAVARRALPRALLVMGGKDHAGQLGDLPLRESPALDVVVRGEAEETLLRIARGEPLAEIPNLVYREADGRIRETEVDLTAGGASRFPLDYGLQPDFLRFAPSVEVSRGCTFGCEFCVSARTRVRRFAPDTIVNESVDLAARYADDELRLYFETPMFLMPDREISALDRERSRAAAGFTWRTETRVDYLNSERLRQLHRAGLRVLDLGFESGCPEILVRMGKTHRPDEYLERAREILEAAYDLGILVKLNVLFYLGETRKTIRQTLAFLEECRPWVQCVSAYPLMLYPGTPLDDSIERQLIEHGGSLVSTPEWQARRLQPVNPSADLGYSALQELGIRLSRGFQTAHLFFLQKRYGYLSPGTRFEDLESAARAYGFHRLPFSENEALADRARRELWNDLRP